jgi:hypothetical protein
MTPALTSKEMAAADAAILSTAATSLGTVATCSPFAGQAATQLTKWPPAGSRSESASVGIHAAQVAAPRA